MSDFEKTGIGLVNVVKPVTDIFSIASDVLPESVKNYIYDKTKDSELYERFFSKPYRSVIGDKLIYNAPRVSSELGPEYAKDLHHVSFGPFNTYFRSESLAYALATISTAIVTANLARGRANKLAGKYLPKVFTNRLLGFGPNINNKQVGRLTRYLDKALDVTAGPVLSGIGIANVHNLARDFERTHHTKGGSKIKSYLTDLDIMEERARRHEEKLKFLEAMNKLEDKYKNILNKRLELAAQKQLIEQAQKDADSKAKLKPSIAGLIGATVGGSVGWAVPKKFKDKLLWSLLGTNVGFVLPYLATAIYNASTAIKTEGAKKNE